MYSAVMASKELVAASSRPILLSILSMGESYGYAIIREVQRRSGGKLKWTDGMLYPVLHRLEGEGLIKSRWGRSDTGRKRRYYCLSRQGGKALEAERAQWMSVHDVLSGLWRSEPCRT